MLPDPIPSSVQGWLAFPMRNRNCIDKKFMNLHVDPEPALEKNLTDRILCIRREKIAEEM